MTAQTWQILLREKHKLSLRLFLLLNALSAAISIASPIIPVISITTPIILVLAISLILLSRQLTEKSLNPVATLLGILWAFHIVIKSNAIANVDMAYLFISLVAVLFIGSISFINNIAAFSLYCLPATLTFLWLDHGEHGMRALYSIALSGIGIVIQHIIQKRSEHFTHLLMNNLQQEKQTFSDLSMLDPLTGLYNRRGFQHQLNDVLTSGKGSHYVLLLDIDHFKAYNDHYGHTMGDKALIRISAAIYSAVRKLDVVTRYGGEEFLVLLTNINSEKALQTAERIRQCVSDLKIPHRFNGKVAANVTVSIGFAPLKEQDIDEALRQADKALYRVKNEGRNNVLSSEKLNAT